MAQFRPQLCRIKITFLYEGKKVSYLIVQWSLSNKLDSLETDVAILWRKCNTLKSNHILFLSLLYDHLLGKII